MKIFLIHPMMGKENRSIAKIYSKMISTGTAAIVLDVEDPFDWFNSECSSEEAFNRLMDLLDTEYELHNQFDRTRR